MPIDHAALGVELNTDPQTYGYQALINAGNDVGLAALLNKVRDGTDGELTITVRRSDITSPEIFGAIAVADYTALSGSPTAAALSQERRYLAWLSSLSSLPSIALLNSTGGDTPVIANFKFMFSTGTPTYGRLWALANRFGSRAEELFGVNTRVNEFDVAKALGRP